MRGIGTRSVASVALLGGAALLMGRMGHFRADYWAQLSPWVPSVAASFAVLASALVFRSWRLFERGEYYLRVGRRLPLAAETALGPQRGVTLLVGNAPQVRVLELPAPLLRVVVTGVFLAVGMVSLDNRAIELLRESAVARTERRSADFCPEPEPPVVDAAPTPGCALVERAFQLGYAKSLGSCAPKTETVVEKAQLCERRQLDEPYLHYAWRLLDGGVRDLIAGAEGPSAAERFERAVDHLGPLFHGLGDTISMQPRSSHHIFTNLPAPRAGAGDRLRAALDHGCGAELARLPRVPPMEAGPTGPGRMLEHVLAQLLFNPLYRPVVAQCDELAVHWDAPADACARLAADPSAFLDEEGALDAASEILERRRRRLELVPLQERAVAVAAARRVISFQCLIVGEGAETTAPIERQATLEGEPFSVREMHLAPLAGDGGSQVRMYKAVAALLADGFGYGRLTSTQTIGAAPEDATLAASFQDTRLLLSRLDLLRDADLFLGNAWLIERTDLLEVYPHHLHLKNFVELFRRQYALHRGRL
jgi:hypothetical protein